MTETPLDIGRRPATDSDEDFLFQVFFATRAGSLAAANLSDAQIRQLMEIQFRAQRQHYRARHPDAEIVIVEIGGEPIGYLNVESTEKRIVLVDIALLPAARRRGNGTRLLLDLFREADARGLSVVAHVETTNPARRLYRRMGFDEVSDDGAYVEIVRRPDAG